MPIVLDYGSPAIAGIAAYGAGLGQGRKYQMAQWMRYAGGPRRRRYQQAALGRQQRGGQQQPAGQWVQPMVPQQAPGVGGAVVPVTNTVQGRAQMRANQRAIRQGKELPFPEAMPQWKPAPTPAEQKHGWDVGAAEERREHAEEMQERGFAHAEEQQQRGFAQSDVERAQDVADQALTDHNKMVSDVMPELDQASQTKLRASQAERSQAALDPKNSPEQLQEFIAKSLDRDMDILRQAQRKAPPATTFKDIPDLGPGYKGMYKDGELTQVIEPDTAREDQLRKEARQETRKRMEPKPDPNKAGAFLKPEQTWDEVYAEERRRVGLPPQAEAQAEAQPEAQTAAPALGTFQGAFQPAEADSGPRLSPDGKYIWNGKEWVER